MNGTERSLTPVASKTAFEIAALALALDDYPIRRESYQAWRLTYQREQIYGQDVLYAGPLFIHLFSHIWLDFRDIHDGFNRQSGISYFENTAGIVQVQSEYARRNPRGFQGYNADCWRLTACDGPTGAMETTDDIGGDISLAMRHAARLTGRMTARLQAGLGWRHCRLPRRLRFAHSGP